MHNEQATAHTPGPWSQGRTLLTADTKRWPKDRWEENEHREKQGIYAFFSAGDEDRSRQPIAQVMVQSPEWEANARLIAAAPDLYELAKLIAKLDANYGLSPAALFHVKERAEAAIAKTTSL